MTKTEASKLLKMLINAYPTFPATEETQELYIRMLADIPAAAGFAATLQLLAQSKFFPTIAELREAALDTIPDNRLPTALEAWGEVVDYLDANRYCVVPEPPQWSHPLVGQAAQAIGLKSLFRLEGQEHLALERTHFLKLYETKCQRERQARLALPELRDLLRPAQPQALLKEGN